jgi:mRNA interferase RelE/StbE
MMPRKPRSCHAHSTENQERIIRALKLLLADRTLVDIKPLKGRNDWRLRVGDYRVIFIIDNENKVYFVTKIGPRGDVYKE